MTKNILIKPSQAALGVLGATLAPIAANAQGVDTGVTLSFDAAIGNGDISDEYYRDKFGGGDFDDFDADRAFVGSVGASGAINETWDWTLSVSRTAYQDNVISESEIFENERGPDEGFFVSAATATSRTGADIGVGRSFDFGVVNTRVGLGLAYASAESSSDFSATAQKGFSETTSQELQTETKFQGIGAKLSLDAESMPVTADGRLSVIAGAEISQMSGQYTNSFSKGLTAFDTDIGGEDGSDSFAFNNTISDKNDGNLLTGALYLGGKYALNDNAAVRFGLRRDVTVMEVADLSDPFENEDEIETDKTRDTLNSAFIGMDIKF